MDDTTEVFRQAVTSTMRAISGNDELSVTFGRGKPYMQGSKARLPAPEAGLGEEGLAVLRGTADRFALKERYHDAGLHLEKRPDSGVAQEIFDAVEEARLAVIGSHLMRGVQDNLSAELDSSLETLTATTMAELDDFSLGAAVGLMIRERLIGAELPPAADRILSPWRKYLGEKIDVDIEDYIDQRFDQSVYSDLAIELMSQLDLLDEYGEEDQQGASDDLEEQDQEIETEASDEGA